MAKKSSAKDYFGLPRIVSLILAFFFGGLLGIIVRFLDGKPVAGIVRLILAITGVGYVLVCLIDFFDILLNGHIWRPLNS